MDIMLIAIVFAIPVHNIGSPSAAFAASAAFVDMHPFIGYGQLRSMRAARFDPTEGTNRADSLKISPELNTIVHRLKLGGPYPDMYQKKGVVNLDIVIGNSQLIDLQRIIRFVVTQFARQLSHILERLYKMDFVKLNEKIERYGSESNPAVKAKLALELGETCKLIASSLIDLKVTESLNLKGAIDHLNTEFDKIALNGKLEIQTSSNTVTFRRKLQMHQLKSSNELDKNLSDLFVESFNMAWENEVLLKQQLRDLRSETNNERTVHKISFELVELLRKCQNRAINTQDTELTNKITEIYGKYKANTKERIEDILNK
eukprot:NODE_112_length_18534_cov_1.163656.p7 type:complete len:317 gc:universal NODE_112_length_18534_cov_1.163656:1647-2597(+)